MWCVFFSFLFLFLDSNFSLPRTSENSAVFRELFVWCFGHFDISKLRIKGRIKGTISPYVLVSLFVFLESAMMDSLYRQQVVNSRGCVGDLAMLDPEMKSGKLENALVENNKCIWWHDERNVEISKGRNTHYFVSVIGSKILLSTTITQDNSYDVCDDLMLTENMLFSTTITQVESFFETGKNRNT